MEQIKIYFEGVEDRVFTPFAIQQGYLESYLGSERQPLCHDFIITKPALTDEIKDYIQSQGFVLRAEGYDLCKEEDCRFNIEDEDHYQYYYVQNTMLIIMI